MAPAVGTISMIVGGLTFGWTDWILLLSTSYAVCAIALVPEGLSATVTSILTVVARRLKKKSVYLKVSRRSGIWFGTQTRIGSNPNSEPSPEIDPYLGSDFDTKSRI